MFVTSLLFALAGPRPTPSAPPRVLVYTVSAGFEHEVVKRSAPDVPALVETSLLDWARESGGFEAVITRESGAFEAESLARFAAVLFFTTGELPLSALQREALFAFVRRGGGFVGVHSAADTFYDVPEYGALLGAYFDGHPWHERVPVVVEDPLHAATSHLGDAFEIHDEIYQFRAPWKRSDVHVLLSLDAARVDVRREGVHRADRDFALAWTRPHGLGRVFYTALGHRPEVWADERFRRHLVGGIRWATRTEPRVKLSERDEARRAYALDHTGDPLRGRAIFSRGEGPGCARCHAVDGAGASVGPDLSSLARRLGRDEIADALLAPSLSIAHGFEATTLELADGTRIVGRILRETEAELTLVDAAAETHTLRRADVKSRAQSRHSLMPAAGVAQLSDEQLSDLVAYLATLQGAPR